MNVLRSKKSFNDILKHNIFLLFSIFPTWLFKFNVDIFISLIVFCGILILFFFHNIFYKFLIKRKNIYFFYLALIFTVGVDNSLFIFSDAIAPNFLNIIKITNLYYFSLIVLLTIFFVISLILLFLKDKGAIIIFTFIFALFIQASIFSNKTFNQFPDFETKIINTEYKNKVTLIFIMDQMAGLNSDASKKNKTNNFDNYAIDFSKKFNANIYKNVYSLCGNTDRSISKLLNFNLEKNCKEENNKLIQRTDNFFNEYVMMNNKLFEKFNSVSVFQNYFLDYCKNKKVSKCEQYSQFKKYNYIPNFKYTKVSRIVGGWKHHGSILANITWRLFLHYNFIDSFEQSGGEKGSFVSLLQNVEKDVLSNKYDLIFVHSLATHSPYGFDFNCKYDGEKYINYRNLSYEKKIEGQNIDRFCTLKLMEKSLENTIQKNSQKP